MSVARREAMKQYHRAYIERAARALLKAKGVTP